ncbi:hypothetical protein TTHERM_00616540 (macronuclear) [Tetrahymena thermophila SB210]|uniref:Uncharacterized protein n=1 Tax=Tetrahymena thermophila (strain SB210) TaxID=312017 RepID=I7M3X5_TETTS|nr:hypothetical protein TTHERM_00616540 [Tetrahymena thermophila SB210]EAS04479.1 hypothetical protein TTHERM_00616540 [Tetrahymena thermophila SB210]|eukprot:XP_001024724.1 hypothetical protein TTHERM_00616540 [Tetrahymena thermophila SB210]
MENIEYISELIRLEYLQSLQQNRGKSFETLQREEDIMITFSDLNVWFLNNDSDKIDEIKQIFDSLEQNKLGKASLRDFMRLYSQKLMDSVQSIQSQQLKISSLQNVISNAQCIQHYLAACEFQTSEDLSTRSDSASDLKRTKENNYSDDKNLQQNQVKYSKEILRKMRLQIKLKEILNIDLKPSFSNPNLEGYMIEIGEEKKSLKSGLNCLEGATINFRDEVINLTIRPKCKAIFIKLYEVLASCNNLVAQIIIDPFSLLFHQSFNNQSSQYNNFISTPNSIFHLIPLQSINNNNQIYCNLQIQASVFPLKRGSTTNGDQVDLISVLFDEQEWINSILQARSDYMSEKLNQALSKCSKTITNLHRYLKPFKSIKLGDNYQKFCQI